MVVFSVCGSWWKYPQVAGHSQMDDEHFTIFQAKLQKFCSAFNRGDFPINHCPLHSFKRHRMTQVFSAVLNGGDGAAYQEGPDAPADNFNFG
jgi:hypothetical protein